MEIVDCIMDFLHRVDPVLTLLTLVVLGTYVWLTGRIAKAAGKQNQILTTPMITATIVNKGETVDSFRAINDKAHWDLNILIVNHSALHANAKIKMCWNGVVDGKPVSGCLDESNEYGGLRVWNVPAKMRLFGHTKITQLSSMGKISDQESLILSIHLESKNFEVDEEFKATPPTKYKWDNKDRKWIPAPT